jgi:hypothetical protein
MWQRREVSLGADGEGKSDTRSEIVLTEKQADVLAQIIATLEQLL